MKRRAFLGLGVSSIGVGALYGTGAFSAVSAGRGVSISATDDPHGLIGITNVDTSDDPEFVNKTSLNMKVKLTDVDPHASLTFITSESESDSELEFSLSEGDGEEDGESKTVEIERDDGDDSAEVEVVATLYDGGSSDVLFEDGIKRAQIKLQRDFTPSPFESIDFTGEAEAGSNSGDFEFELRNESDIDVELTAIGINATTSRATKVADPPGRSAGVLSAEGESIIEEDPIYIDNSDEDSDTRTGFDGDESFTFPGDTGITFKLDRFSDDDDNVGMRNENVRATIYFKDNNGSEDSKTFDLCLNEDTCGEYNNNE